MFLLREWLDGLLLLITSVLEENAKGNPVLAKTGFKTSLSADKMDAVRKYSRSVKWLKILHQRPNLKKLSRGLNL